jgi:aminomethyltransferase
MRQTPLFGEYGSHGAKVVDFHGWALPVQFEGIIQEHLHTRSQAGLFDCSHMGEFLVCGADRIRAFDRLVFSDMIGLKSGRCRYSGLLNASGGIIDDCVALKLADDTLYVVTNAGPLEEVAGLLGAEPVGARDVSADTAKLDLQGPRSREILLELGLDEVAGMAYWTGVKTQWRGADVIVTRAGYTGELGYELFATPETGVALWRALTAHPAVKPCGLGARDTLRTEMGYPLNGEDVWPSKTPLDAGMERFIAWDKDFVGKPVLDAQRTRGGYRILTAVKSATRQAPRHGYEIRREGQVVGTVTSGTFGPSVGCGVGLADLDPSAAEPGTRLTAGPRNMELETAVVPIYKNGTCRMKVG